MRRPAYGLPLTRSGESRQRPVPLPQGNQAIHRLVLADRAKPHRTMAFFEMGLGSPRFLIGVKSPEPTHFPLDAGLGDDLHEPCPIALLMTMQPRFQVAGCA